jgi:hypothetical protein
MVVYGGKPMVRLVLFNGDLEVGFAGRYARAEFRLAEVKSMLPK